MPPPTQQQQAQPPEGDAAFVGVNSRLDATNLPPGFLKGGRNIRCRFGEVDTRLGITKPLWANLVNAGKISPSGQVYGSGDFKDPAGLEWLFRATDGLVYRIRPYTTPFAVTLPDGVQIITPVSFTQAFSQLYMFRGTGIAPLVLSDLDTGFTDLLPEWNNSTIYKASVNGSAPSEVAYGQLQALATLTRVSNVATGTTTLGHGLTTGQTVRISGAVQTEYNGRYTVTVVDTQTFTYVFPGSTTATATGTIVANGMMNYWRAIGKTVALASITRVGTTATATFAAHGFSNTDLVTISGATLADGNLYNGTFAIQNVTANTFDYLMTGTPTGSATGTPTAFNPNIPVNEDPVTKPGDWLQLFTILPAADNAIYVQNRLMLPTGFNPATATYGKKDFVVATDILDNIHFDFPDQFRINQGSSDELIALAKFNDTTVIAFKDHTIGVISNVALDLSAVALDIQSTEYGLTGPKAFAVVGADCVFLAARRGIVSLRQTELNKLQGVDLPLSDRIDDVMRRLNWNLAYKAAFAYWDNKLFCAVPLDDAKVTGRNIIPTVADPSLPVTLPLVIGRTYIFTPNGNAVMTAGTGYYDFSATRSFVATTTTATLYYFALAIPGQPLVYNTTGVMLQPVFSGVNNAVIVYDYLTGQISGRGAAGDLNASIGYLYGATRGEWSGYDTGTGLMVHEWVKFTVNGQERLFFLSEDGFLNLYEESDAGDQVYDISQPQGLAWEEITTYALFRGYLFGTRKFKRFPDMDMLLGTYNASYSVNEITEGVNESVPLVVNKTRDRTKYYRPFDAPDYDTTNVNLDAAKPYRQDYSAPIGPGGLLLGSGTQDGPVVDLMQEFPENLRGSRQQGSSVQYEVINTRGRIKIKSIMPRAVPGTTRRGTLV